MRPVWWGPPDLTCQIRGRRSGAREAEGEGTTPTKPLLGATVHSRTELLGCSGQPGWAVSST
jgi:hypothetical protein